MLYTIVTLIRWLLCESIGFCRDQGKKLRKAKGALCWVVQKRPWAVLCSGRLLMPIISNESMQAVLVEMLLVGACLGILHLAVLVNGPLKVEKDNDAVSSDCAKREAHSIYDDTVSSYWSNVFTETVISACLNYIYIYIYIT